MVTHGAAAVVHHCHDLSLNFPFIPFRLLYLMSLGLQRKQWNCTARKVLLSKAWGQGSATGMGGVRLGGRPGQIYLTNSAKKNIRSGRPALALLLVLFHRWNAANQELTWGLQTGSSSSLPSYIFLISGQWLVKTSLSLDTRESLRCWVWASSFCLREECQLVKSSTGFSVPDFPPQGQL